MNNGNPFSQFTSMTPQMLYQMQNQVSNFNSSYQPNTPMIEKIDFKNQNNFLHNNVGDSVFSEYVTEYTIHMDSADRDISLYGNPFKFTVHFNDTTQPNISRRFKNVKYIRLENIILPKIYKISPSTDIAGTFPDASGNVFSSDSTYTLTNEKYLLLKIKELANDRVFSTGNIVKSDTIKIYFDVSLNSYYNSWTTNQNSFVFSNGNLGNIKRLTFELYDSDGTQLLMTGILSYGSIGSIPTTNLTHPSNKYTQMAITLIFGIVENEVNTNTKYEN